MTLDEILNNIPMIGKMESHKVVGYQFSGEISYPGKIVNKKVLKQQIIQAVLECLPEKKKIPLKDGDRFYKREQGYNSAIDDMKKRIEGL